MINDLTLYSFIAVLLHWLILIAVLLFIPRKRKSTAAIAWILIIFFVPVLGITLYFVIGSTKLSKRRRDQQKIVDSYIRKLGKTQPEKITELSEQQQNRYKPLIDLNYNLSGLPARSGNKIQILAEYNKIIADIVKEIDKSREFISLQYFILALDDTTQPIFDALEKAIERGVKVRVLFDSLGIMAYPRRKEMKQLLTNIGAEWHPILPLSLKKNSYNRPDLRNHRKILVIDDNLAYIGSQNLIDRSYHRKDDIVYDELVAKIKGPAVRHCSAVFAGDWFCETNQKLLDITDPGKRPMPKEIGNSLVQILPSGSGYKTENNALLFSELIHTAKKSIVITNPYFVPDETILSAVKSAAYRGVEVTIINSEAIDQWLVGHAMRSFYKELLESGIKIYLYKKPTLLHSKHITIDDDIAVIGSSNMDIRSFELNLECVLVAYDKQVVSDLKKVQKQNLARSRQLNLSNWSKRGFWQNLADSVARLTSSLQ